MTSKIIPVGFKDLSKIALICAPVKPLLIPRKYIAASVAIVNAKNGFPINPSISATDCKIVTYLDIVPRRISTNGINTTLKTRPNGGSSFSLCTFSFPSSGRAAKILFPIKPPHMIPAINMLIMAVGTPTIIIIPRLTSSAFAVRTDPADGGTNAYPLARPANNGIA